MQALRKVHFCLQKKLLLVFEHVKKYFGSVLIHSKRRMANDMTSFVVSSSSSFILFFPWLGVALSSSWQCIRWECRSWTDGFCQVCSVATEKKWGRTTFSNWSVYLTCSLTNSGVVRLDIFNMSFLSFLFFGAENLNTSFFVVGKSPLTCIPFTGDSFRWLHECSWRYSTIDTMTW